MGEITVILLLALIFLGPKKLPDLASGLGKLIREIRKATSDVKNEIAIDETFRKPFEELRDAVTLHPDELKRRDELKRVLEETRRKAEELIKNAGIGTASDETDSAGSEATADAPHADVLAAGPTMIDAHLPPPGMATAPEADATTVSAPPSPAAPTAPPLGTVSAPPTRLGPPRVTPPVSSAESDAANKTQILSEEDLLPPSAPRRRPTPPPLPGLPKPKKT
jgi:TatA/E family protein of Tat protein translocase